MHRDQEVSPTEKKSRPGGLSYGCASKYETPSVTRRARACPSRTLSKAKTVRCPEAGEGQALALRMMTGDGEGQALALRAGGR